MKYAAPLLAALLLSGCASDGMGPEAVVAESRAWRTLATQSDRDRMGDWRTAFVRGLGQARGAGHGHEIEAEGVLLQPDAATGDVAPPPGDYRCRTIKIGAKSPGLLDYIVYPPFRCRLGPPDSVGVRSFAKLSGSQRPMGRLFPESDRRLAFLGTLQLGDEQGVMRYGYDTERDMAGWLERVGPARWRLILPLPHFESTIDVLELVPET